MKEQIITFETAKLAKEKKFDIFTKQEYMISSSGDFWLIDYNQHPGHSEEFIKAPSQSLLQKWLREEHNIHIHICPTDTGRWLRQLHTTKGEFILIEEYFDTYEEALEDGLIEALKLI
jgi:hypothetical protein